MPSFLSITTLLLLLLLLSSIHVSSGLPSRRHLALDEQDEDLPKKKTTLIDQDQSPALKSKKKLVNSDNSNPKKKVADEDTPLKPKKKAIVVEEDNDLPLTKPKKKKVVTEAPKKKVEVEEEEIVKPKKKAMEENSQLIKPTKKVSVAEEGESPAKVKKKIPESSEAGTPLTKTTKKVIFDSKNQTVKLTKPKKINSTAIITKPINKTTQPKKTNSTKATSKMTNSNPSEETTMASWFDSDDITTIPDDLISDFRDLPSRLLPDLSRLSTTSKAYISRANQEIAKNVKPYVGHHAAATVASVASAALLALPLLLLTFVFHRVKTYLTLQRLLIFIQAYLAIYFGTLAFIAVVTGLEPLRFFAAASPPSYAVVQTIQTLGYVIYLVVQMLHVAAGGEGRWLGVAQMVVGLAVGVHYYAAVFHRAVAGEPPRANWRVHAVYAGCFVVICACARAERRKKAYLAGGGGDDDDGKKS